MKHAERFARAVIDAVDFQLALEGRSWMFRWRMRATVRLACWLGRLADRLTVARTGADDARA